MQIQIDKKRMAIIVAISLLFSVIIFIATECFLLSADLATAKSCLKAQQDNSKAGFFTKLFINKVLLSTNTIGFEDRLSLENAVRDLADPEIFSQWQKFVASKDDGETQKIVGSMLKLLTDKIYSKK